MISRSRFPAVLAALMILSLVSCSALSERLGALTGSQNTPAGVAQRFLDAIENQDPNQYLDALDPDLRDQPNYFLGDQLTRGILSLLGLGELDNLTRVAFRETKFRVLERDETTAYVLITGKVRSLAVAQEFQLQAEVMTRKINGKWYVSAPTEAEQAQESERAEAFADSVHVSTSDVVHIDDVWISVGDDCEARYDEVIPAYSTDRLAVCVKFSNASPPLFLFAFLQSLGRGAQWRFDNSGSHPVINRTFWDSESLVQESSGIRIYRASSNYDPGQYLVVVKASPAPDGYSVTPGTHRGVDSSIVIYKKVVTAQ